MDSEPEIGDAFGEMLRRLVSTQAVAEIVERDDGFIDAGPGARYFAERASWPELDVVAVERCTGRVLDVGVAAGRAALDLQAAGRPVVGLDTSPGAVAVSAARGVRDTFVGTVYELAAARPEPFDTILLLGNNLGLLEGSQAAPRFLAALGARVSMSPDLARPCGASRPPLPSAPRLSTAECARSGAQASEAWLHHLDDPALDAILTHAPSCPDGAGRPDRGHRHRPLRHR